MNAITHESLDLRSTLVTMLAKELRLPEASVEPHQPLTQYGLDSIAALTIAGDLEDMLDMQLPATLLWDCPTINELADSLNQMIKDR